jgi:hypothetical protein
MRDLVSPGSLARSTPFSSDFSVDFSSDRSTGCASLRTTEFDILLSGCGLEAGWKSGDNPCGAALSGNSNKRLNRAYYQTTRMSINLNAAVQQPDRRNVPAPYGVCPREELPSRMTKSRWISPAALDDQQFSRSLN